MGCGERTVNETLGRNIAIFGDSMSARLPRIVMAYLCPTPGMCRTVGVCPARQAVENRCTHGYPPCTIIGGGAFRGGRACRRVQVRTVALEQADRAATRLVLQQPNPEIHPLTISWTGAFMHGHAHMNPCMYGRMHRAWKACACMFVAMHDAGDAVATVCVGMRLDM